MVGIGILNLFSSAFIDGICVVALAPAVIIIRGHLQNYIDRSTFLVHFTGHASVLISFIKYTLNFFLSYSI